MNWEYRKGEDSELLRKYKEKYNLSEKIIRILLNRNLGGDREIDDFINPDIRKLRDPFKFESMSIIVENILDRKKKGEKIFIYGDYDVDGITSAAFLTISFKNIGIDVDYYIPDRMEEGYGLNKNAIDNINNADGKLIITVDVGVNSEEEISYAKKLGIDVIVTDHHKILEEYGDDIFTINPKVSKTYEFKSLSGAGVALKLAEAVYSKLNVSASKLYEYMDIIMIGTVADVVPMVDENRIIIKKGLEVIKNTKVKGLTYLLNYLKLKNKDITTTDVSYFISPLLNALGRIGNSKIGVDFFMEQDEFTIYNIIEEMKNANKKRRNLERFIFSEVLEKIKDPEEKGYIFLKSDKWHPGVIGVVAAKLSLKYNIPVILISLKDKIGKASCRSVNNINIFEILKENSGYFIRFGGHDLAAGFIAREENLKKIEEEFEKRVNKYEKPVINTKNEIKIDLEIELSDISEEFMREIRFLAPLGIENPHPILCTKNVFFSNVKKFGVENQHFKAVISKNKKSYSVIGFNLGNKADRIISEAEKFDIVYYPEIAEDLSGEMIQLKLKDFKPVEEYEEIFTADCL